MLLTGFTVCVYPIKSQYNRSECLLGAGVSNTTLDASAELAGEQTVVASQQAARVGDLYSVNPISTVPESDW